MLDTCFVFLVSDYVMADGSLATIAERMLAGADAIQAGNFQLNEEIAELWLQERLAVADGPLSIAPREMVCWGLGCLHPATLANTVNYPLYHNAHTNRLFWRVDRDTLIGRFYLLHQICIRPQRTDFVIASASDYSFVAEMCPTGNVVILTDSDEYFVAEVQPLHHESKLIRLGPQSIDDLVECLSEWTNHRHRLNAEHTIIFHANDLPASLPEARSEADRFIAEITPRLGKEQPFRNHPYWIGAIAALNSAMAQRQPNWFDSIAGLHVPLAKRWSMAVAGAGTLFMQWARSGIVGQIPNVSRFHPRWKDYRIILAACEAIADPSSRLLIETSDSTGLGEALRQRVPNAVPFSLWRPLPEQLDTGIGDTKFDAAFIGLVNEDPTDIEPGLRRLAAALRPGGQIVVAMLNTDRFVGFDHAGRAYPTIFGTLASAGLMVTECRIGAASWWRWWSNVSCALAVKQLISRRYRLAPLIWLRIALWGVLGFVANVVSSFWPRKSPGSTGIVSSCLIRLTAQPKGNETLGRTSLSRPRPLIFRATTANDVTRYDNVFDGITPWSGYVPPGYLVDFSGAMTAAEFANETDDPHFPLMVGSNGDRLVYTRLPRLTDGEPWFQTASCMMAARTARERFVTMTLGAHYGARAVCGYRVLQQLNPMPCTLVAVEPVPENYARIQRHFRDNGLDPADHWLVPHVVAANTAPVLFPVGAASNGGQKAIAGDKGAPREYVGASKNAGGDVVQAPLRDLLLHNSTRLIQPIGDDADITGEAKLVSAVTLRELLAPFTCVDYLVSGIRHSEIDVFSFAGLLRRKVRLIHICTHEEKAHRALQELFAQNWQIVFSFRPNAHHETILGGFDTNHGILTVLNPDL
jgi:hypothetical protein